MPTITDVRNCHNLGTNIPSEFDFPRTRAISVTHIACNIPIVINGRKRQNHCPFGRQLFVNEPCPHLRQEVTPNLYSMILQQKPQRFEHPFHVLEAEHQQKMFTDSSSGC
jgi:hypothetical protein